MKGTNKCAWLLLGMKEVCGKSCLRKYCKVHNARLAKGGGTTACSGCGKGVKNRFMLCQGCGYDRTQMRIRRMVNRAFLAEFKRLAAIEIPI